MTLKLVIRGNNSVTLFSLLCKGPLCRYWRANLLFISRYCYILLICWTFVCLIIELDANIGMIFPSYLVFIFFLYLLLAFYFYIFCFFYIATFLSCMFIFIVTFLSYIIYIYCYLSVFYHSIFTATFLTLIFFYL